MTTDAVLRPARPADIELVCELIAEYYELDGHRYDEAVVRRALIPLLRGEDRADPGPGGVWLIMADSVVNGYAVMTWGYAIESGGPDALLDEIYVRSRGDGLGGRALAALLVEAGRGGARRIFLETERRNDGARRFYARHGFEVDDSIWMSRDL